MTSVSPIILVRGEASKFVDSSLVAYRGTDREWPRFFDELEPAHPLNLAFMEYLNASVEGDIVHDVTVAIRYCTMANEVLGCPEFEVLEVVIPPVSPVLGGAFLGIDVSHGASQSLVRSLTATKGDRNLRRHYGDGPVYEWSAVQRRFRDELNQFELFKSFETADAFLLEAKSFDERHPGFLEGGGVSGFSVIRLYLVSPQERDHG